MGGWTERLRARHGRSPTPQEELCHTVREAHYCTARPNSLTHGGTQEAARQGLNSLDSHYTTEGDLYTTEGDLYSSPATLQ